MSLHVVTGNANKFKEIRTKISDAVQCPIDLPEIQGVDPREIVEAKLEEAIQYGKNPVLVEDTSLHLDAINGLPGPLVKWFLDAGGCDLLYKIANDASEYGAQARCTMGLYNGTHHIFEGVVHGRIVPPQKSKEGWETFGWDAVFMPDGFKETYAQMGTLRKSKISHRTKALEKLTALYSSDSSQ